MNTEIPLQATQQILHKEDRISITFIHNIIPAGKSDQGMYQDDPSISRYTLLFREDGPVSITQKKWIDFTIEDYIFFWDVFSNKIKFGGLQDQNYIKIHDLFEIVAFTNPQAIQIILNDPELFELLRLIRLSIIDRHYYVHSKHSTDYAWKICGWRPLYPDLPCCNSSHFLSQSQLSQWILRSFPRNKFLSNILYI